MSELRKVLVTGGAGFIGSHTVDLLLEEGVDVRVIDNLSTGSLNNLPETHPRLEFVQGDICNLPSVMEAMKGVTHCIHLAAQVSVAKSIQEPVCSSQCNVQGFLHVLEAARKFALKRIVYASSAAVYGVPAYLPLDEAAPVTPISPYGLEKLIDEKYANLYSKLYGTPTMGLRYFNVYGPRQDSASPYSGVISIFMDRIRKGLSIQIYGDGLQTRDYIYVKDVARANVCAITKTYQGECNVATGHSTTLLELLSRISEIGGEVPIMFSPARQADIRHSKVNISRFRDMLMVDGRVEELASGLRYLWDVLDGEA